MTTPIHITHYLHTAIRVSDLAKAEQFYSAVLGLTKVERSLRFPGVWYQLGDVQIHLIEDAAFASNGDRPEKWGRDRHLAFAVSDLDAAQHALDESGYPVQRSASGRPALFTQDPDGNIIELSQVS